MFRNLHLTCAVVALMLGALFPCLASAQAEKGSKVYDAFASFYQEEPNGCTYFETFLDVYELSIRSGAGPVEHSSTIEFLSLQYDTCEDVPTSIVSGSVAIPANAFRSQGLKSASLTAAVNFTDRVGGAIVPVFFDLVWTCDRKNIDGNNSNGNCAPVNLSGSVLVGWRNLLDSQSKQGELSTRKF
jgi:hypothetical protein